MSDSNTARLLPWATPDGKACLLVSDGEGYVSRVADSMEAVQLDMAAGLLGHAAGMLDERSVTVVELRYLCCQLVAALRDVCRVAESRGARLAAPGCGCSSSGD
ncbi:hypothetical protein [Streptomyces sp. NPDC048637]|uniref:hypothetical protein n=1 Tax=Streptomyces sp. NPDC048637 TaxID=3155636 RepID=UPI00341AADD8